MKVQNPYRLLHWAALFGTALLLLAVTKADAEEKVSWRTDLRRAAREANRQEKHLLVDITASWCSYCRKMSRETYADARIINHINKCFVPVSVDIDRNRRLVELIGVEGVPTTVILSPDLRIVKKLTGFQSAKNLGDRLERICGHD